MVEIHLRRNMKRGPYKQYVFKDSAKELPKSTHHALQNPRPQKKSSALKRPASAVFQKESSKKRQRTDVPNDDPRSQAVIETMPLTDVVIPDSPESAAVAQEFIESDWTVVETCGELVQSLDDSCDSTPSGDKVEIFKRAVIQSTEHGLDAEPESDSESRSRSELDISSHSAQNSSDSESESDYAMAHELQLSVSDRIKLLLLLATKKRHNLTYSADECIVDLAGLLTDSTTIPVSKHSLKRCIDFYSNALTEHHLCPQCGSYIGIITDSTARCASCDTVVNASDNKRRLNYFLYMSLKDQIRSLLECGLADHIINVKDREKIELLNLEDIFDGKLYKLLVKEGWLSFNFFVDGLQVNTTNKRSAWPVLININELPLNFRRKHVLMASVWLGKSKPNMNEYLKPFVKECIELHDEGLNFKFNGTVHHVKVKALMCISDSIARPLLRCSTQFNGKWGCGLCYHPGIKMRRGRGKTRSYSIARREYPLRTHLETIDLAEQAEAAGKRKKGIKGKSILSNIEGFDIVRCVDLDLFHALVNTAKRFASLWFDRAYANQPFSVRKHLDKIDKLLLAIKPSAEVSRAPRSLSERSDFRGHEWFYWVVFYSLPVLKPFLPARYLNHWALLVHSIALLMQNSVAKSEVCYADKYLKQFNVDIDRLYGPEHVTFSCHLLTHLARSVLDFGQPWTHSAFMFESFLGEVKGSVKSSSGIAQQICKHMQLRVCLFKMKIDLDHALSTLEKAYLKNVLSSSKKLADPTLTIGSVSCLGPPIHSKLSIDSFNAILNAGFPCVQNKVYPCYLRVLVNDEVYHSCNYLKPDKQDNTIVLLDSDNAFHVDLYVVIEDNCLALGHFLLPSNRQRICDLQLQHIRVFCEKDEGILKCVPVLDFRSRFLSFIVKSSDTESLRVGCLNVLRAEMLS